MVDRIYPSPEGLEANQEKMKKLEEAKIAMAKEGIEAPPSLLKKINEISSQTREGLPKWVTNPQWIDKLEDLKGGLTVAIKNLEGKPGSKHQIVSLQAQLTKVEKVLNQPKDYLQGKSKKEYAQTVVGDSNSAQASNESLEKLNKVERACLESMRQDFDRGIVLIDDNADKNAYQAALKEDKTAGQSWETVQGRLLANEASLLKEAVELSKLTGDQEGKGACLVGVYENGELAIRQRSSEIVNAIVNKKGELRLSFHPEAQLEEGEQWAKAVEIVRAVKVAGYHVPADAPDRKKRGLVVASEAVTGADYVASPNKDEWRDAMLECPDNVSDSANVRVVYLYPNFGYAGIGNGYANRRYAGICDDDAYNRNGDRGAVLWLRG